MIWIFWSNRSESMCCNREEQNTIILIIKKLTRKPVKWLRTRILVGISYKTGSGNHHVGRMTKPRFYSNWILAGCQLKKAMQAGRQASQKSTSQKDSRWVFGSVVVVAFQIAFRAEIHVNDVFLFFKNHFWYQHIKTIQKVQTALNFSKKKKKNLKITEKQVEQQSQTLQYQPASQG